MLGRSHDHERRSSKKSEGCDGDRHTSLTVDQLSSATFGAGGPVLGSMRSTPDFTGNALAAEVTMLNDLSTCPVSTKTDLGIHIDFDSLQSEQYRHDCISHADIANALVPARLTHFTLHFAKYVGALVRAAHSGDQAALKRSLVDTLIIALAAANALSLRLSQRHTRNKTILCSPDSAIDSLSEGIFIYAEIVGRMAKACEVKDHFEDFPSRLTFEQALPELLSLIENLAKSYEIDLISSVRERWKGIEGKWSPDRVTDVVAKDRPVLLFK